MNRDTGPLVARRRIRLAPLVVGLGVLAAGCVSLRPPPPPPPPQPATGYCAPSAPTTPAGYQAAFDGLRTSYTEWESADGAVPVDIGDGRIAFLFGDTYVGRVGANGAIDPAHIIRNSFIVQNGNCFAVEMGGVAFHRTSLIPEPAPNQWYWPASGVMENGVLRVFLWHMTTGNPFQTLDMQVATFDTSFHLLAIQAIPYPTDATHPYGATSIVASDGFVYLYGTNLQNARVARVPLGQITNPSAWSVYKGLDTNGQPTWSANAADAVPMQWNNMPPELIPGIPTVPNPPNPSECSPPACGPLAQPWVNQINGTFVATAKLLDGFSQDISAFTAPTPAGPWTYAPPPAQNPIATVATPGLNQYGAYTRMTSSGPMVEYNTNRSPFANPQPPLTIQNYGPHFISPARYP